MKRDWDLIRDVLIEVEGLNQSKFETLRYGPLAKSENAAKDTHAILLWKSGFIEGAEAGSIDLGESVIAQELTWTGLDLLDTLRSKPLWDRIKTVAKEKGIELTFDSVKALGKLLLDSMLSG